VHFDYSSLSSDAQVGKVGNSGEKNVKTERAVGWKPECPEIEPNPSKDRAMPKGDNPSFGDEFTKFTFFLTVQFIFVF
jgi:hypothetical protein